MRVSTPSRSAPSASGPPAEGAGTLASWPPKPPSTRSLTHPAGSGLKSGKGVASRLISATLEIAREDGAKVLPFCPFVRGYIAKHPDRYLDLVPADLRSEFELPATAGGSDA